MLSWIRRQLGRADVPEFQGWVATPRGVRVRRYRECARLFYDLERAIHRRDVLWVCGVEIAPLEGVLQVLFARSRQSLTYGYVQWADGVGTLRLLNGRRAELHGYGYSAHWERHLTVDDADRLYNELRETDVTHVVCLPDDDPQVAVCLFRLPNTWTLVGTVLPRDSLRYGIHGVRYGSEEL